MRRILEDYEAKLRPVETSGSGSGKVEWERYADGNEEFYARFRKLDLPDGARVEIRVDQVVVGHASISSGAGRLKFESEKGQDVPKAVAGQLAEVIHEDVVLLRGKLRPD